MKPVAPNCYIAYTDGAARGNPGPAGVGVVIQDDSGKIIAEEKLYLGETTNNVAEYRALLLALEKLAQLQAQAILIRSDSQLMVRQLNGEYRVKNEGLRPLFQQAMTRLESFSSHCIEHISRDANAAADQLANQAIDEQNFF